MTAKINFKKSQLTSTFLDPRQEFKPTAADFQVRVDPLTGRTGHFSHFGAITPQKLELEKYNDPAIKGFCPFCREIKTKVTPKFCADLIPEGRLSQGEAFLVPNLHPYDIYSCVTIMTDDHVVPLEKFSEQRLFDAFSVGMKFLRRVKAFDPSLPYHLMTWNYMPPSGGGLVHPHQQYFASANPGNQFTDEYKASGAFYQQYQTDFWPELIAVEQGKNERYLGQIGSTHWLTPFVSTGVLGEIMCICPGVYCIDDFTDAVISDLIKGLQTIFRYFKDNDIYSFNASLFWGAENQNFFPAHLRIIPRTFLNTRDFAPDANFFQLLLQEPLCVVLPEDLCRNIKIYFDEKP